MRVFHQEVDHEVWGCQSGSFPSSWDFAFLFRCPAVLSIAAPASKSPPPSNGLIDGALSKQPEIQQVAKHLPDRKLL